MRSKIKKNEAKRTKFEFNNNINMNNFEKNPTKGGIPAIDSRDIIKSFVVTCVLL